MTDPNIPGWAKRLKELQERVSPNAQNEFARHLGVSVQTFSNWTNGKVRRWPALLERVMQRHYPNLVQWVETGRGEGPQGGGRMIEVSREELAELDRSARPYTDRDFFITISDADSGEIILGYPAPPGAVVVNSIDIAIRPKANFGNIKDTEEVSDTVDHRN